ncbi:MAG: thioredoxin domain-containing protein, partial [Chitinophagaceae bacterium]
KFPQTFTINFLLRYSHLTGNEQAKKQALLSLDKMAQGGLYDHAGGGFARYSTDAEWLVPHFEKMLYDNALLVDSLCEAYGLTGDEKYKEVIEQTLEFVQRELTHESGGFYSALDADSEGVEGKFYVWDYEEVKELLGEDADIFCKYYNITPGGNWEGHNILFVKTPISEFAAQNNLDEKRLKSLLATGREKLLQKRSHRVRPQLDDKILLSWNALMNTAYIKAYAATGNEAYRHTAERNMEFLLSAFKADDGLLHHTWKGGVAKYPAFLDDYSYLIAALIELAQATGNFSYLDEAEKWTQKVLEGFSDRETPLFFFTHATQTDILLRKKEVYDGATPSGNSVMAQNLYRLSILLDRADWRSRAESMLASFGEVAVKYPTSFGVWLALLMEVVWGTSEIAIVGEDWQDLLREVQKIYLPHRLVMAAQKSLDKFPLLSGRDYYGKTAIYLCENYACRTPVSTIADLKSLLASNN